MAPEWHVDSDDFHAKTCKNINVGKIFAVKLLIPMHPETRKQKGRKDIAEEITPNVFIANMQHGHPRVVGPEACA